MAHYYFHLVNGGDSLIDPEGRDMTDASMIPAAALRDARNILSHDMLDGEINLGCAIEVRDDTGGLIYDLSFHDAVTIIDRP
jgi:hypothetical protein